MSNVADLILRDFAERLAVAGTSEQLIETLSVQLSSDKLPSAEEISKLYFDASGDRLA